MRTMTYKSPMRVVMRMTDDYIVITDCLEDAHNFVNTLVKLSASGLIRFNKNKLKANFPLSGKDGQLDYSQLIQTDYCQWVGIAIDMKTLEIMPHYNCAFADVGISININIPSKRPKLWLCRKMNWYFINQLIYVVC